MKTRMAWLGTAWLVCSVLALAQSSSASLFDKIRAEGYDRSQAAAVFNTLTIDIGPRLTASPAHKRAAEYMRDRLAAYGLANARLEPWKFGRGWTLEHLTVEMIEPRYLPLIGYADAWSNATAGDIVGTPVFVGGKSAQELTAMSARLKGAILMTQPMMTDFVRKDRPQPSEPTYVANSAAYATSVGRPTQPRTSGETPAQQAA
jgi:hypothetical protein